MRFPHQGTLLAARYATRRMSLLAGLLLGREPQCAFAEAGAQSTAPSPHLMRQLSDVSWRDAGEVSPSPSSKLIHAHLVRPTACCSASTTAHGFRRTGTRSTNASWCSAARCLWAPAIPLSIPPARAHHAMIYDPDGARVLLIGGSTPVDGGKRFLFFDDLWSFDGKTWRQLQSLDSHRSGIALARSAGKGRILSFGGYSGAAPFDDVRELDGGMWRVVGRNPAFAAAEAGFVFDERLNRFVAFGGAGSNGRAFGDTWAYDSAGWSQLPVSSPAPAARQGHVMVYDIKRGRTIVFGGDGDTGVLGDTWSYDGTTWRKLADTGPAPRAMGYIAYDAKRDRIVLFGGRKSYPDGDLNDTWEWDGAMWKRCAQ